MELLRKITPPLFMHYFEYKQHLYIERMDAEKNYTALQEWLKKDDVNPEFMKYWIEKTTPVFGQWNWVTDKCEYPPPRKSEI